MPPFDEKPFRSEEESAREPAEAHVHMGHPRVRPHVVPVAGKTGEQTVGDFVTSFLVAWQPSPTPPAHWIELLRAAPFGAQAIRARDLHWDGRSFSIELLKRKLTRDRPRNNAVNSASVDQKFDLHRASTRLARLARIGDFRGGECNSHFFGGPFRARTGDPLIKSHLASRPI